MKKISVQVIKSIFMRKGKIGKYTMLFDELNLSIKNSILSKVKLHDTETPVIVGIKIGEYCYLITDEKLIIFDKKEIIILEHADIKDVSLDIGLNIQLGDRQKKEFSHLSVLTFSGQKLFLKTEPGPPFIGVWNVLKTIAGRNSGGRTSDGTLLARLT